jgi:hypothetical protein
MVFRRGLLALLPVAGLLVLGIVLLHPTLRLDFWNADDWLHLDLARGLREGEREAWRLLVRGPAAADALRVVPAFTWVATEWIWGIEATGQYALNLVIVLAAALVLFDLGRRLSGSRLAGLLSAALWLTHPAPVELVAFLSAREDGLALLFALLALDLWIVARGRLSLTLFASLVLGLGLASKSVALAPVPAMLLSWRQSGGPWRRLAPLGAVVLLWSCALSFAVGDRGGDLLDKLSPSVEWDAVVLRTRAVIVPVPLALGRACAVADGVLPLLLGALLVQARLRNGRGPRAGLRVALAGLLSSVVLPLPFLLRMVNPGDTGWRYLALPLAFAALAVGASLRGLAASRPTVRSHALPVAVLTAACIGGALASPQAATRYPHGSAALGKAVLAAAAALPEGGGSLIVELARPDGALSALLAAPDFDRRVEGAGARLRVRLLGTPALLMPRSARFSYGRFVPAAPPTPGDPRQVLLRDHPLDRDRWHLAAPPEAERLDPSRAWAVEPGPSQNPRIWHRDGESWRTTGVPVEEARLEDVIRSFTERRYGLPLPIQGRNAPPPCALDLDVRWPTPPSVPNRRDESLIESGLFAVLSWDPGAPRDAPWVVVPLPAGGEARVRVDFRGHPAWPGEGGLRLSSPNTRSWLDLERVAAVPCGP